MKLLNIVALGALALSSYAVPTLSFAEVAMAYGPATCAQGFVWREAANGDKTCVTVESRSVVADENARAASRVNPDGAYGPNTCVDGFVWREAFAGDMVCVTPARRNAVATENSLGQSRRAAP